MMYVIGCIMFIIGFALKFGDDLTVSWMSTFGISALLSEISTFFRVGFTVAALEFCPMLVLKLKHLFFETFVLNVYKAKKCEMVFCLFSLILVV